MEPASVYSSAGHIVSRGNQQNRNQPSRSTRQRRKVLAIRGPLQRRVLGQLWSAGPSTTGEIRAALNATTSQQLAYTTVNTILGRLCDEGFVHRILEGRHYRYEAAFDESELESEIGRRDLRKLIDQHGSASVAGFAADLGGPTSDLAVRLRRLADGVPRA